MNFFATNLKFLIRKFDTNQDQLASYVGKNQTTISNYINKVSEPDIEILIQIHHFFGISIDALIFTDLKNSNLITQAHLNKFKGNSNLIIHPIGNVKPISEQYFDKEDQRQSMVKEPDPVATWAIMGQLKILQEKLDHLTIINEKALKEGSK